MQSRMNRSDWMARTEAANQAASRWAFFAAQHEAEAARGGPWSPSVMSAMAARGSEARCRSAAASAKEMAFDVR